MTTADDNGSSWCTEITWLAGSGPAGSSCGNQRVTITTQPEVTAKKPEETIAFLKPEAFTLENSTKLDPIKELMP